MIAKAFRPVAWVAGIGAAALVCYMLSLQVAAERAELAKLERSIVDTRQQIRSLHTELGTRGRLQQLEAWNADVLALSAPVAGQFLDSNVALARFDAPEAPLPADAPVRMAAADSPAPPAVRAAPVPSAPPAAPQVRLASATAAPAEAASPPAPRVRRAALDTSSRPADKPERAAANSTTSPGTAQPTRETQRRTTATTTAPRQAAAPVAARRPPANADRTTARTSPEARAGTLLDDRTVRALGSESRSERARN